MSTLSVSELKARLSEQIRRVKAGEEIVVTERGMPVARLVPLQDGLLEGDTGREGALRAMERAGLVRLPTARLPPDFLDGASPPDPDGLVRQAVLEEREGGR